MKVPDVFKLCTDPTFVRGGYSLGLEFGHERFQCLTDVKEILNIFEAKARDKNSAACDGGVQSFDVEHAYGFPRRDAGHTKLVCQIHLP